MKSKSAKKLKSGLIGSKINKTSWVFLSFMAILITGLIITTSFAIILQALQSINTYLINFSQTPVSQTNPFSPTPTLNITAPQIKVSYRYQKAYPITTPEPTKEWGIAKQIGEHTWTMNVGEDERMATPQEIFEALNNYRFLHQANKLSWNEKLTEYAQSRADYFASINKTDAHVGFINFLENQDGFRKLEFGGLGENSSYGYKLLGVHLIEWVFAGDKPHNDNQLNPSWTDVGIGINQTGVDIIFAKDRL